MLLILVCIYVHGCAKAPPELEYHGAPVPTIYTLCITVTPDGWGTVGTTPTGELTPSGRKYVSGTAVELNATSLDHVFSSWEGDVTGETTPKTITMASNKNVTARFKILIPASYTLTTSISPPGSGTVTPSSGTYSNGDIVAITAEAGSGYVFASWEGDLSGSSANPTTITMSSDKNVIATFILNNKIHGDYTGCGIGVFLADGDPTSSEIDAYESLISREVAVVMWFKDFTCDFPTAACEIVSNHKCIPMITWEPWKWGESTPTYPLSGIIAGDFDNYIKSFALAAKTWGKPVFLRFGHEMNGNWYPWDGSHNGNSTANYVAAWRRVHATFEALGATKVTWVWCPMNYSVPSNSWNNVENYYPGNSYVDWVAFDGYSDSGTNSDAVFSSIYSTLTGPTFSNKPIMIGETARGTGDATNKPDWITDAFNRIKNNYPNIKSYTWFNINKESDWRINSSPESLNAFKASMTDKAYYLSTIH